MNESLLLYVMAGAAVVAMLLQAGFLAVMAISARSIKSRLDVLTPKVESFLESAERTMQDSKKQITEVTTKANSVLAVAQKQVERTDEFFSDATNRARRQLDRLEMVMDDSIGRMHETVVVLNDGILKPLRELSGIAVGIRSAINFLLRGGRPSVDRATTDEEMFI